jgi:hypothetical protein
MSYLMANDAADRSGVPGATWHVELFRSPHESDQRAAFEEFFVEPEALLLELDLTPTVTATGLRTYLAKVGRETSAGYREYLERYSIGLDDLPRDRMLTDDVLDEPTAATSSAFDDSATVVDEPTIENPVVDAFEQFGSLRRISDRARANPNARARFEEWRQLLADGKNPGNVESLALKGTTLKKLKCSDSYRLIYDHVAGTIFVWAEYDKHDEDRVHDILRATNFREFKRGTSK